jgi:hypothetical protein
VLGLTVSGERECGWVIGLAEFSTEATKSSQPSWMLSSLSYMLCWLTVVVGNPHQIGKLLAFVSTHSQPPIL